MRALKSTIAVSLAALTLGLSLVATPAVAKPLWPHPGYGHFGPGLAFGLIGAFAGAAILADSCVEYRPVYDQWGNYVGRRPFNVCD